MLMKCQALILHPDLYMRAHLILEVCMVMFSLTYPPWHSIMENNLNIFIAKLSELKKEINLFV